MVTLLLGRFLYRICWWGVGETAAVKIKVGKIERNTWACSMWRAFWIHKHLHEQKLRLTPEKEEIPTHSWAVTPLYPECFETNFRIWPLLQFSEIKILMKWLVIHHIMSVIVFCRLDQRQCKLFNDIYRLSGERKKKTAASSEEPC